MSARAVEAAGVPFAPAGDELHDADVALDEIASFTGNVEPVVLRVAARGGWPAERRAVEGDWLCADHEPPKRVQRPAWNVGREGRRWAAGRPWLDAWESCQRGDWMIYAAVSHRLGLRLAAAAVCACVEPSARFLLRRHERSFAEAIRGVRDLAAGRRSHVPLQRSLSVLYSASRDDTGGRGSLTFVSDRNAMLAAMAAVNTALAYEAATSAKSDYAAAAVGLSAGAFAAAAAFAAVADGGDADAAMESGRLAALRSLADVVRAQVPTVAVLRLVSG